MLTTEVLTTKTSKMPLLETTLHTHRKFKLKSNLKQQPRIMLSLQDLTKFLKTSQDLSLLKQLLRPRPKLLLSKLLKPSLRTKLPKDLRLKPPHSLKDPPSNSPPANLLLRPNQRANPPK